MMTPCIRISSILTFLACIQASSLGKKVIVTGAAGRTGSIVFSKLLKSSTYSPVGIVKSEKSAKALYKLGASKENVVICDVTNPSDLEAAFVASKAEKVVLCTSAVPQINYFSIVKVFIAKILKKEARPEFSFIPNGDPYNVDWLGAKHQVDAAKKAKINQFVFVSSMGGTDKDNFLNTIGRKECEPNSGNILLWKRKAEQYLIASGIPYTIVHPGGLLDKPSGERELIFGIDDQLLKEKVRSIPRGDVAEVCVQSLSQPNALRRSFDIISREPGTGTVTKDWKAFFAQKGNCKY